MSNTVYQINKGINRPIYFKGLQGQYIIYLAVGLVGLMILFLILFFLAVPMLVCVLSTAGLGLLMTSKIYRFSNRYGEHGLLKIIAQKKTPKFISIHSRRVFSRLVKSKPRKERVG